MKKIILTVAALLLATSAFATTGSFVSGAIYSVGSIAPSSFKTSPKVTIAYYMDAAANAASTDWAAVAWHLSSVGNKKGYAYWTAKSDPGMWYYKDDSLGVVVTTITSAAAAATPTEATGTTAGWRPEGK